LKLEFFGPDQIVSKNKPVCFQNTTSLFPEYQQFVS
jgi:hypothetical protein